MTSFYHLDQSSLENVSATDIFPVHNIVVKQEITEMNETVPDFTSLGTSSNICNELNIKEEVLSESEDVYYSSSGISLVDTSQNLGELNNLNVSHDKFFQCMSCDYNCHTAVQLLAHSHTHNTNATEYVDRTLCCAYCTYKTKRRSHFNDHIRSHTGDKPYKCSFCDYKSGLKGNLKRHVARIHYTPTNVTNKYSLKIFRCAHCSYTCPSKGLLIRHVKMHVFGSNSDMYNLRSGYSPKHIEHYTDYKPLNDILESQQQPEFIDIHSLNLDHTGSIQIQQEQEHPIETEAENEQKDLPDFSLLKMEADELPRNVLKCRECKYTCLRKTHLNDHVKTHSGEKPFVCILCNYRTGHKSHLTRHMKVHVKKEGSTVVNIPPPQPVRVKKQVFRCLLCGYKSQIKHCFAKHMRLHLGVALFTCNICDFSAKCSADIKKHIKIHEGRNEFYCNICDYMAKSKGRLRRHFVIHR